jgi:hypothetical protein
MGCTAIHYVRVYGSRRLLKNGDVSLRRVEIDVDAAIAALVAGSAYPDRIARADEYLRTPARDAEAITAFGPRDGRA